MGGFEKKPGGSSLTQHADVPLPGAAPGKRTLTSALSYEDSPKPPAAATTKAAVMTDAEIAAFLSEQDQADAIEDAQPGGVALVEEAASRDLGPPDGIPLASYDHGTHWESVLQRMEWIRENFPRARFASVAERQHYEDLIAHGAEQHASSDFPHLQPSDPLDPASNPRAAASGPRYVRTISFVAPGGVLGPMIREDDGWLLQTSPDPSAGYNFDTYLYDSGRGRRIPAMALGGTRFRVLMGTAECPGCHFGHGLEVDLYGQNFMEIVAMMAVGGAGVMGGGAPIPMDEGGAPTMMPRDSLPPRPAGPPDLRVVQGGGGPPIMPRPPAAAVGGPRYATTGSAALQVEPTPAAGPQSSPVQRPQLSLVPEAAAAPETAAAPRSRPTASRPGPGVTPMVAPLVAPQPAPGGRKPRGPQCPPGTHPVRWPLPIWTTLGYGDTGARDPEFNRPSTPTLTRVRTQERDRSLPRTYVRNNPVLLRWLKSGVKGAVHHKVPLYVGGPELLTNLVFLPSAQHAQWHDQLARQGTSGWMPFDPFGTVYCVL